MIGEPFVARNISQIVYVLAAVDLDHQPAFPADEIDDIRADRLLAHEFAAIDRARAQPIPQLALCVGGVAAKPPGTRDPECIGSAHRLTHAAPAFTFCS